jgi:hypothetical protein
MGESTFIMTSDHKQTIWLSLNATKAKKGKVK